MRALRKVLLLVGAMVLGGALWDWLGPSRPAPSAPVVPRLDSATAGAPAPVSAREILEWGRSRAPIAVVDTARDTLPNGLALSMVSILVDWDHSRLGGDDPFVLVRNVSVGGNPVAGRNVLGTVRVPLDGLREVQWCLTLDRSEGGRDLPMGHSQLRFLFDEARRPRVEGLEGLGRALAPRLDDLILSWEAWRPPRTGYDPVAGLDPETYALTVRAYAGAQRFLGDALRGNPWVCYPLALPATGDAYPTLLVVGLAMGDSFMRRMLHAMVEDGALDAEAVAGLVTLGAEDLAQLRAVFAADRVPEDPMIALMGGADLTYQLLERSCITQSLTAVQWALERIHAEHGLGPAPRMKIVPEGLPPWMEELAHAGTAELLARLPAALWFVARNQSVLPGKAWRILDDAGLLRRGEGGEVISYYYHLENRTPYGSIAENLM